MRLTTYTDYSLRVLIYLAVSPEKKATIREIAQDYGISRNHLMKVVQELSQRGYVTAIRGKNGGLSLNKTAAQINIGDLVEAMEKDMALTECLSEENQCILTPACALMGVMNEALQSFLTTLNRYTLEDIVAGQHKAGLIKVLNLQ